MATKPKTYPYAIYRDDNSYLTYDITRADYDKIVSGLDKEFGHVELTVGLISLKDIRAVIELKEVEPVQESANPVLGMDELAFINRLRENTSEGGVY